MLQRLNTVSAPGELKDACGPRHAPSVVRDASFKLTAPLLRPSFFSIFYLFDYYHYFYSGLKKGLEQEIR